ncbi:DUF3316 domain-containing protein [Psychromonas arctica]|uniref:DUF3316 domain-containing protein n=1 Tax=Psychromonas arctica TaxID=168275 RepID=UPI002FD497C8
MKKLTTLAAALLISTGALASTQVVHSDKVFNTDAFADKAQAYDAGFDYIDDLEDLSDAQLRQKLIVISQVPATNIEIDNSKVFVEEFSPARGEVAYRAVVDVDYHFTTLKNDN